MKCPVLRRAVYAAFVCLFLAACSPSIKYTGKTYTPSTHVDIYSSAAEVKTNYIVMGTAKGSALMLTDYDKIKKKLLKAAKAKGADGLIFSKPGEELVKDSKDSTATAIREVVSAKLIKYQ